MGATPSKPEPQAREEKLDIQVKKIVPSCLHSEGVMLESGRILTVRRSSPQKERFYVWDVAASGEEKPEPLTSLAIDPADRQKRYSYLLSDGELLLEYKDEISGLDGNGKAVCRALVASGSDPNHYLTKMLKVFDISRPSSFNQFDVTKLEAIAGKIAGRADPDDYQAAYCLATHTLVIKKEKKNLEKNLEILTWSEVAKDFEVTGVLDDPGYFAYFTFLPNNELLVISHQAGKDDSIRIRRIITQANFVQEENIFKISDLTRTLGLSFEDDLDTKLLQVSELPDKRVLILTLTGYAQGLTKKSQRLILDVATSTFCKLSLPKEVTGALDYCRVLSGNFKGEFLTMSTEAGLSIVTVPVIKKFYEEQHALIAQEVISGVSDFLLKDLATMVADYLNRDLTELPLTSVAGLFAQVKGKSDVKPAAVVGPRPS